MISLIVINGFEKCVSFLQVGSEPCWLLVIGMCGMLPVGVRLFYSLMYMMLL